MSQLDKALDSTLKSIESSIGALHPLSSLTTIADDTPSSPIRGLASSFTALLQQLRQTTTALSLSFKPPVSQEAAIAKLQSLDQQYGQLASCVVLANNGGSGSRPYYMVQEWREGTVEIGNHLLGLIKSLSHVEAKPGSSSSSDENPYLVRTGMVWEAIDATLAHCSENEVQAVGKVWKRQNDLLKDAWEEFKEVLEDGNAADEEDGLDDFEDDSEAIFGKMDSTFTAADRARAEAAKPLLALHLLLHSTVPRYLPQFDTSVPYTSLVAAGDQLASAFDDTVSAIAPPQDKDSMDESLNALADASACLIDTIKERSSGDPCVTFLDKWANKFAQESQAFRDHSLSLRSLRNALE
ncbi:hypothetical protein BD324DRAFT_623027 [Kockovaella imperatae]|uniref:Cyclin-D1-binding protein 1-like N-terminal domain-containing protein n=1 Tax=Kockovaella imperatae TaxID=4999 RepID=A0A1Y1UJT3_9TREE|nr:hypothetical protein BD324DRAFT_623027 [Kockovaella imperatae]ORX37726.1 hypothetical protein BD324DRAFT_623027 [Kockovaella imperatae]